MYTITKRYILNLEATGVSPGDTIDVPFNCDDAVSQLAVRLYTPDATALGTGTVQVFRNGAGLGAATAWAGNMIVVPADPIAFAAANSDISAVYPSSVNATKADGMYGLVGGAITLQQNITQTVAPPAMFARVINTAAAKRYGLILVWTGLIWRP